MRSNHRSDHRVDTNSRPTGREPKWDDGSRTHSLPGLMGKEHYAENAHPGFVPDKNQFKLPRSGFTRVLTTSLWASRLKNGVSSEICEKRFAKFGDVVLLKLFPDEASALVRFANRKTVVEALYGGKTELDSSGGYYKFWKRPILIFFSFFVFFLILRRKPGC